MLHQPESIVWHHYGHERPSTQSSVGRPSDLLITHCIRRCRHPLPRRSRQAMFDEGKITWKGIRKMVDRREFLAALMATAVLSQAEGLAEGNTSLKKTGNSLVPEEPSSKPNYWCTWAVQ